MTREGATTTRPLRIAMISYYLPSGSKIGVGYQVHELANEMVRRGHEVTVFSGCGPSAGALYTTQTVQLQGSNRTFRFALRMRNIDWSGFDVLHAHGDDYWLWRRRVPVHVRTLHGSCFSEALRIRGARERMRMALLGVSEVMASVVADTTVTVSAHTRRWTPWVRSVVPNGVDLQRFRPGVRTPFPTILFVGTFGRRKRGRLVAEAFERTVLPAHPDARLWMVAEDAPSGPSIDVLGRASDRELASLYGQAWVFCLPSTYEGFGIPYVEAMASGCPVVATRNPGSVEVTDSGRFGRIVEAATLDETLLQLLESPEDRERMRLAGLARSAAFDLRTVAARYESIYRGDPTPEASGDERLSTVTKGARLVA